VTSQRTTLANLHTTAMLTGHAHTQHRWHATKQTTGVVLLTHLGVPVGYINTGRTLVLYNTEGHDGRVTAAVNKIKASLDGR